MEELDVLINSFPGLTLGAREEGDNVYQAAKAGFVPSLRTILAKFSPEDQAVYLNKLYLDEGQQCTPLIIASRLGHHMMVAALLELGADRELEGIVKFDGHIIEGATPLWCSAGAGYLEVVRVLVEQGADVNHETRSKSTPLRAACFRGRLDIVVFLREHGADMAKANKYNNTCLMISSYKGHESVVRYLLEQGADANARALCGATALHFAAEIGHIGIVECLLLHGARLEENEHGMTPLLCAAERCQAAMVDFFIQRPEVSKTEAVEAQELLGASFANDKDNYDIGTAYCYLQRAMAARWQPPVVEKTGLSRLQPYDNWRECRTVKELAAIAENPNAIHMEGLCIRERILGNSNPEVPYPIIFRGAVFADSGRFDSCTKLWLHALRLRQDTGISVAKDLLRFAQMFSQMLKVGREVSEESARAVLSSTVLEIERTQLRFLQASQEDKEAMQEELEHNMLTALYLVVIITKIAKQKETLPTEAMQEIFKLVQLNPVTSRGYSLLHLCVDPQTPVDEFHTNEVCRFPCAPAAKLLLEAGADPQCMDNRRNTPLHIIVTYQKIVSDFISLHSIIMALLESGAHIDCVNALGKTPLAASTTGVAEIILKSQSKISLQCMAAQSIRKYNLFYEGQVPKSLESFIQIHGP